MRRLEARCTVVKSKRVTQSRLWIRPTLSPLARIVPNYPNSFMTSRRWNPLRSTLSLFWLRALAPGAQKSIGALCVSLLTGLAFMQSAAQAASALPGTARVVTPAGGFGIDGDLLANTPTNNVGDWLPNSSSSGTG